MSHGELFGQTIDIVEIAVTLVIVLFIQHVLVKALIGEGLLLLLLLLTLCRST